MMKKLIGIILILFAVQGMAQQLTWEPMTDSLFLGVDTITISAHDTIKVMYLLCNTTEYSGYVSNSKTIKYYNNSVFWEYGFIIITDWEIQCINEDKNKFGENIVIWDYKIIEE